MSSMRKYAFVLILPVLVIWPLATLAQQDATPIASINLPSGGWQRKHTTNYFLPQRALEKWLVEVDVSRTRSGECSYNP